MSTAATLPHRFFRLFARRPAPTCTIEQLFLLHRPTRTLMQHVLRPHSNRRDPIAPSDLRSIASMVTYLLSFLRDEAHLEHYLALGSLRIEQFAYGFHTGKQCILLSVLHAPPGSAIAPTLAECQDILDVLHIQHAHALIQWADNPSFKLPRLLRDLH